MCTIQFFGPRSNNIIFKYKQLSNVLHNESKIIFIFNYFSIFIRHNLQSYLALFLTNSLLATIKVKQYSKNYCKIKNFKYLKLKNKEEKSQCCCNK